LLGGDGITHSVSSSTLSEIRAFCAYLPQVHSLPQLHSLLSFIGQFLPVFLQLGLSAANDTAHNAAIKVKTMVFMLRMSAAGSENQKPFAAVCGWRAD
jgi:hypothetical protein